MSDIKTYPAAIRYFCVCCFIIDIVNDCNYCVNCGAGGSLTPLCQWQIDEIRRNASWVGRRQFPSDEDHQIQKELDELRTLAVHFLGYRLPGRSVEFTDVEMCYYVKQKRSDGSYIGVFIAANSEEEAFQNAAYNLPFVQQKEDK